jgi:hypothetical protein
MNQKVRSSFYLVVIFNRAFPLSIAGQYQSKGSHYILLLSSRTKRRKTTAAIVRVARNCHAI